MNPKTIPLILLMIFSTSWLSGDDENKGEGPMTPKRLHAILSEIAEKTEGQFAAEGRMAQLQIEDIPLLCLHDEAANRMRLLSPIKQVEELEEGEFQKMLAANYHSALDGRYCVADGTVYAAFIHPLDSMNERDLISAVYQVLSLNASFGDTYSSGVLSFGEEDSEEPPLPNEA